MEDVTERIIIIAISLLLVLSTVSVLVIYYNTAIRVSQEIAGENDYAQKLDYSSRYDEIMQDNISETTMLGADVRSLIRKYIDDDSVTIEFEGKEIDSWRGISGNVSLGEISKIVVGDRYIVEKTIRGSMTHIHISASGGN